MGAACGTRHASILRRGGRRGCAASSCHSSGSLPSRPCRLDFSIVLGTGCAPWSAPLPAASIEPLLLGTQSGISTISRVGTDNYIYIFFSFQMFQFLISVPARQRRSAASSLGLGRVCAVLHAASQGGT